MVFMKGAGFRPFLFLILAGAVTWSCGPKSPIKGPDDGPLRLLDPSRARLPRFVDVSDQAPLIAAIDRQLRWFDEESPAGQQWRFGSMRVDVSRMRSSLLEFRRILIGCGSDMECLDRAVKSAFDVYQVDFDGSGRVLMTGYHAPVFAGSLTADDVFRFPLYRRPDDLIEIQVDAFDPAILDKGERLSRGLVPARLDSGGSRVLPYYSRREIDQQSALGGRDLEIVFLKDYMDAFLFHVQGGGFVALRDGGYINLNYAGKNGWPYVSIGRLLVNEGKIPPDEISIPAIKDYFAANPGEMERVCMQNPSYVFYAWDNRRMDQITLDDYPHGVLGFPVTPRRSIATDKSWFPGGALCFVIGKQRALTAEGRPDISRFVIDQDTGGAIEGAHIDLFMGSGREAESDAGLMMDPAARVYMLLLKDQ